MASENSGAPPVLHTVSIEDKDQYYQGEVLPDSNIRHGEGTLLDKKEMYKYIGSFKFGMKDGEAGQLEYIDDEAEIQEYTGGFKEDKFHGMGILYFSSGQLFKGEFDRGNMKEGIMKYENGEEYTGPFKDGKRDGYGIMKYNSGEQYCGDFVADLKEGKGILSHFDTVINGVWKADVLIMGQHKQADGVYFGSFDEKKLPSGKGIFSYQNGYIY